MLSNLPPGVTDNMLPGSRPEDQEMEVCFTLTQGEIDDLINFDGDFKRIEFVIENLKEQLFDQVWIGKEVQFCLDEIGGILDGMISNGVVVGKTKNGFKVKSGEIILDVRAGCLI